MAAQKITIAAALRTLVGRHHAHGCYQCAARYTDACHRVEVDALCQKCRGAERPLWDRNGDVSGCCTENARLCTPDELKLYKLAGIRSWFRCRICSRTHPFNPKFGGHS